MLSDAHGTEIRLRFVPTRDVDSPEARFAAGYSRLFKAWVERECKAGRLMLTTARDTGQKALAARTGIVESRLTGCKKGKIPSGDALVLLADEFGVSIDDMFRLSGREGPTVTERLRDQVLELERILRERGGPLPSREPAATSETTGVVRRDSSPPRGR